MDIIPDQKYGILLNKDILLHRRYFSEMVRLLGIQVIYQAPISNSKNYTIHGELRNNYQQPEVVGCIFNEHPDQRTLKKMGWVSELQEDASIIHVPYDLHDLQKGALFIIPSGLDASKGRLFRVVTLSNIMVYPASIACEIVPEYEDSLPNSKLDRKKTDFNLLVQEDDSF